MLDVTGRTKLHGLDIVDLAKPSLSGLSYILRHPDTWPPGFRWDYRNFSHCACGLADAIWRIDAYSAKSFARNFDIPRNVANKIIYLTHHELPRRFFDLFAAPMRQVKATDVADLIDAYLEKEASN